MARSDERSDSLWKLILIPVLIALLVGTSSPWWWDRLFPPATNPPARPAPGPTPGGGIPTTSTGTIGATAPISGGSLTDCTLTVSRPFAEIRVGPNFDETRAGDVPEGTYQATETTLSEWATTEFRWFRITAGGRDGWIVDNGFMFQEKSSGCP